MARIASERRASSAARVPAVLPGTAIVFTRYDVEKAVVLSPHDFHRLSALDEDLDELATDRIEPSELALRAHHLEDRPGAAVEDPAAIRSLLGL